MEKRFEVRRLLDLSITKKTGWQQDDSPVVRGDYGDVERAWNRLTKAKAEHQRDALMKQIESAINNQRELRRRDRASGSFVPQPILISVFLNKKRFMDEIEVTEDSKQVADKRFCNHPGCSEEVAGPQFGKCFLHYSLMLQQQHGR